MEGRVDGVSKWFLRRVGVQVHEAEAGEERSEADEVQMPPEDIMSRWFAVA